MNKNPQHKSKLERSGYHHNTIIESKKNAHFKKVICDMIKGMSWMSQILILSYRLKEVTNSIVLHCLEIQGCAHISGTRFRIVMGFGSKCRILNGQFN